MGSERAGKKSGGVAISCSAVLSSPACWCGSSVYSWLEQSRIDVKRFATSQYIAELYYWSDSGSGSGAHSSAGGTSPSPRGHRRYATRNSLRVRDQSQTQHNNGESTHQITARHAAGCIESSAVVRVGIATVEDNELAEALDSARATVLRHFCNQ